MKSQNVTESNWLIWNDAFGAINRGSGVEATPTRGKRVMKAICIAGLLMFASGAAQAQVELKTYVDADGNIDVQKLTCAQLAGTFQEDADFMSVWYSGWYNGLANAGKINVERAKEIEHRVIVYCKANQNKKVITAIDVVIKGYRKEKGIRVKDEQ
jgi:HdeA/HdeB family